MDLTKMNMVELKALAYDIIASIEQGQNHLKEVNKELAKRMSDGKPHADQKPRMEVK